LCNLYEKKEGEIKMVGIAPTKLEQYEKDDALWWCLHHKATGEYLKLRLRALLNAETEEEKDTLLALLSVVANQE
jgi:hypothetical protein